jgi:hypothetical protein
VPEIGDNEILLKVSICGFCGTDVSSAMIQWRWRRRCPSPDSAHPRVTFTTVTSTPSFP